VDYNSIAVGLTLSINCSSFRLRLAGALIMRPTSGASMVAVDCKRNNKRKLNKRERLLLCFLFYFLEIASLTALQRGFEPARITYTRATVGG